MAEWLVEHGIGEHRALLVEDGRVIAARLHWPGELVAGIGVSATLVSKSAGARRGTAALEDGREVLVDHLPSTATEGASIEIEITRAPIAERGRYKRAQGRSVAQGQGHANATGDTMAFAKPVAGFKAGLWEEVWTAASGGHLDFAGGSIIASVTPGMNVIDVDGEGSPSELALAAIPTIAKAIRWFDLGGNTGIDFPTIESKQDRRLIDGHLAAALSDWPHERTAINGFGFVQLVARLEGPSLLHRFATSRTAMCARYAIRVAERASGNGPVLLLRIHPALQAKLKPVWLDELRRRTGRELRIESDPGIALEAPQAQIISR